MNTLILGIGNTLLTDEGIGVHVINFLSSQHADEPGVTFMDGGTLSFTLAEPIAVHEHLIVIDAARLDAPAGTCKTLIADEMDHYLSGNRESVHEVGLMDLLDISRLSETFPTCRALIGIQPLEIGWGERPTPPVEAAIPKAAAEALRLHRHWAQHT
jgi:hydrogenase maturation protease